MKSASHQFLAAEDAAARWNGRTVARSRQMKAVDRKEYERADKPERVKKRASRLIGHVNRIADHTRVASKAVQEIVENTPLLLENLKGAALERIINEAREFLSIEYFEHGLDAARCVGRISIDGCYGTGFLVAPDVVMTNWHVIDTPSAAKRALLQLDFEENFYGSAKTVQSFKLSPSTFFLSDKQHDFALVAVEPSNGASRLDSFGYVPLIADEGKIIIGEHVNIIQHPQGRPKQIVLRDSRLVDLPPGAADRYCHYLADTEEGSSGSPVFNDQWELIALHHQSVPATNEQGQIVDRAGKVLTQGQYADIHWIANEGIRISRIVRTIALATLPNDGMKKMRTRLLANWGVAGAPSAEVAGEKAERTRRTSSSVLKERTPSRQLSSPEPTAPPADHAARTPLEGARTPGEGRATSLVLPLRLEVRLDGASSSEQRSLGLESVRPDPADPDYARRPGYDDDFLGFHAPLPTLADARHGLLYTFGVQKEAELRYHHFSVLMNARRRLAYVSAVNIDANAPFQHERDGADRWFFDPRLPRRQQAGEVYYKSNPLDRGHLSRRDDAAWGRTYDEANLANDDTFHWTNCAPQHEVFNQSGLASGRGFLLWGNLEMAVSGLAKSHDGRLSVFNGPIFGDRDIPYRSDFQLPKAYFKIILLSDGGEPRALAFQLSQADLISEILLERYQPLQLTDFEVYQVPITRLGRETGLDFGPLATWDPLGAAGASGKDLRRESKKPEAALRIVNEFDVVLH